MIYILDGNLLEKAGGKYKLIKLVFERAKELNKGAKKLVEIDSPNFITIALEEMKQGLYKVESSKKPK